MANNAFVFRLNDHGQGPELLEQVLLERGWVEFDEDEMVEHDWNLWWRTSRFRNSDYEKVYPWQQLNHYPKSTAITKKDSLARNLKRMRAVYGPHVYNFSPNAFNLPNDYTKFVADYTRMKEKNPDKVLYWICKPADLSRGRGIFIFRELSELQYDCNAVVQQYITNPMLISGYKFDLRIYVVVPSFHPLTIYVYQEGLVRFSTEKYDLSHLGNMFSHLTNTSINKHSPSYGVDKERIGPGCKWTLTQLRHFWHQAHINDQVLWARVINIVILTLLVQANQVPKASNCFELYGFDIMIDENLKPWLLEVNFSPALSSDCSTDITVKKPLLSDLLDILCFKEVDKERGGEQFRQDAQRLSNLQNATRRSGLGPRKSASKHSTRRSGIGRLPEISSHNSNNNMTSYSQKRHRYNQSQPGYEAEGDENVVPTIPGCGLPSVQHQHPQPRQLSSSSSGHSSACSNHSREGFVSRREPANNPALSTTRSVKSQPPPLRTSSNQSMKVDVNADIRNTAKVVAKRDSNISLFSDSAISSGYSGSSDSSDISPNMYKYEEKKAFSNVSHLAMRTCNQEHPSALSKALSRPVQISAGRVPGSADSSTKNGISCINSVLNFEKDAKAGLTVSSSFGTSLPSSKRKTQHNNLGKKKHTPMSYVANPLMTKSALLNRRSSLNGLSPHKPPSYPKPWLRSQTTAPSKSPRKPPTRSTQLTNRYGDFVLVFPFNEASRRCSNGAQDPKVVISECQKLLRAKINKGQEKTAKESNGPLAKPKKADSVVSDVIPIWGDLDECTTSI